tara:strand:- start:2443 stop:3063 length:621 start_codon:yes stop_codon:yes gene_type:complete
MKAIIIGNAEFNKDEKFGELIDGFDVVYRINRYRVETFEEYLGTKTNIWLTNRNLPMNKCAYRFDFQKQFKERKKSSQDLETALIVTYLRDEGDYIRVKNFVDVNDNVEVANTLEISQYVRKEWPKLVNETFYKPASGILSILYLLKKYDEICIHNFDNAKTNHYFEDKNQNPLAQPQSAKHVWKFDRKMIQKLIEQKKIKYLKDL